MHALSVNSIKKEEQTQKQSKIPNTATQDAPLYELLYVGSKRVRKTKNENICTFERKSEFSVSRSRTPLQTIRRNIALKV